MKPFELKMHGYFKFTIYKFKTTKPIGDEEFEDVIHNLQYGQYSMLRDKVIFAISDLSNYLYSFVIEPTDNIKYYFNDYNKPSI